MKQLQMTFQNSEGKRSLLSLNDVKQDLDEATVKGAMQNIAQSKLFIKDDVALYDAIVGAKYVERTVTDIFDTQHPTDPETGAQA